MICPMTRAKTKTPDEIESLAPPPPQSVIITDKAFAKRSKAGTPKLSRKMRRAIHLRVWEGMKVTEAIREAGVTESGWYRAMERPHVVALLEQEKFKYIQQVDLLKSRHKARAIEIAAELMETASSEAVRMRAVEFFAGESKSQGVNVQINTTISGGYEYARPGQRIVEIDGEAEEVPKSGG